MSDQLIVERGGLEKKDKSELQAIVSALGGTATSRARKADLIDQIIELSGVAVPDSTDTSTDDTKAGDKAAGDKATGDTKAGDKAAGDEAAGDEATGDTSEEAAADGAAPVERADRGATSEAGAAGATAQADSDTSPDSGRGSGQAKRGQNGGGRQSRSSAGRSGSRSAGAADAGEHPVGPDGEPLADWEVEVMADGGSQPAPDSGNNQPKARDRRRGNDQNKQGSQGTNQGVQDKKRDAQNDNQQEKARGAESQGRDNRDGNDEVDPSNRRSRRRGRGRGRDRDDAGNDPVSTEPVPVAGSLDLRDEGYGFLRVAGYLPSKEDVYVSVKQVRQYGLRKGDHLTGLSRPANRNEKNPGFHQIDTVNGKPPDEARNRPKFESLTPLFPDEQLVMSMREEPLNMTTRIIDLVAPIGKGQRGLIVSPPKAGKTTVIKDIARAIETNNPEVHLILLLVDERPEEVTDMRRARRNGEVAASTFDRPPEEHCAVAELTIERAKRMVEAGEDVVVILDGITRLARAYNLSVPQTGRAMSGGLDAGALYPPKRFLGAARNLEEGGSLTILATALVETGSRMDEVIFEEFKGTGNCEIRLDRRLAEKRIFPAIDIDGSSTRNEELLFDSKQLKQAWKLRRVLSGMSEEGTSGAGIEMLIDRLQTFKSNDDFLSEIGKAPSL